MVSEIRVTVDVGSRFHQVAIGNTEGELLEEFRVDHRQAGFDRFFECVQCYCQDAVEGHVAMKGHNDRRVLAQGWQLYTVNNLKLARYKGIFPALAKTDSIDVRRMLELFAFDSQRPLGREVLQEVKPATEAQVLDRSASPTRTRWGGPLDTDAL